MINSITARNYLGEEVKITLNEEAPEHGLLLFSMTGLGPAKASVNTTDLVTSDGGLYNSARLDKRNIVIKFRFAGYIEETRNLTYKYFPIKKELTLFIETDSKTLRTTGYVETNEPDIFSDKEGCTISIICPDPYFYIAGTNYSRISGINELFEFPFEANYTGEFRYDDLLDSDFKTSESNAIFDWDLNAGFEYTIPSENEDGLNYFKVKPAQVYENAETKGLIVECQTTDDAEDQVFDLSMSQFNIGEFRDVDKLEPGTYIIYDGRETDENGNTIDLDAENATIYLLVEYQYGNEIELRPIASSYSSNDPEAPAYFKTNRFTITGEEKGVYINLYADIKPNAHYKDILRPELRKLESSAMDDTRIVKDSKSQKIQGTEILSLEMTDRIEFGQIVQNPAAYITYNGDSNIGVVITIRFEGPVGNIAIYNAGSKQRMDIYVDTIPLTIQNGDRIVLSTIKGNKSCYLIRGRQKINILYSLDESPDWIQLVKGLNIFTYKTDYNSDKVHITIANDTIYEGV